MQSAPITSQQLAQQEEAQQAPSQSKSPQEKSPTAATTSPSNGSLQLPIHLAGAGADDAKTSRLQVRPEGESGRRGIHPFHFLRITLKSSSWVSRIVNVLWPVVPAAIAVRYAMPDNHLVIFILSYLAMVPCANLLGFAGQELARKVPHVIGVLTETTSVPFPLSYLPIY